MKILLFYPEVYEIARFKEKRKEYPPFGIMYLAAILKEENHEVEIRKITSLNQGFDLKEYDVVSYGLSSSCTYEMMLTSRKKSYFKKNSIILAGGVHTSIYPEETLKEFEADAVIIGEGEITVPLTIERCKNKDFSYLKGVLFKEGINRKKEASSFVENLDLIPFPARELLPEEDFIFSGRLSKSNLKMTHIHASRGCPYSCYFCASQNKEHRYRSPENILKEIVNLKNKYGIEGFVINDENFIINEKKVINICEILEPLNMPWAALSRVNTINENILKALKKANCIELKFGLETGSDKMMKLMNKQTTCTQAIKALKLCKKYEIKAKLFLIHGFPGENFETTIETINFLKENKEFIDRISLFRWAPLPGSYVYDNPKKFGIDIKKLSFKNAVIYGEERGLLLNNLENLVIDKSYSILENYIHENF